MRYTEIKDRLISDPKTWLVTGVAGFIGSNLLEELLSLGQQVVGIDNFSTGHQRNLDEVKTSISDELWSNFNFVAGDISDYDVCEQAFTQPNVAIDYVLHQAALGSVPRSIDDPIATNRANITGFLNVMKASLDAKVSSFTYAASSSTYGDHPALPKIEERIGKPLSPYALTKYVNELYAEVFHKTYGFKATGLRYFNVFGKRQDPSGAYAAVIPSWTASLIKNSKVYINGDGQTSRDFCFVENAIQMNILAATAPDTARGTVYNVAVGDRTSLRELFGLIRDSLISYGIDVCVEPSYREFRVGDVRHSQASIDKAVKTLGYSPQFNVAEGIEKAMPWYIQFIK